jgi:hypothetical protein
MVQPQEHTFIAPMLRLDGRLYLACPATCEPSPSSSRPSSAQQRVVMHNRKPVHFVVILVAKFECCGVKFRHGKDLSEHMRLQHQMASFNADLSCCNTNFAKASELMDHVSVVHHYQMKLET